LHSNSNPQRSTKQNLPSLRLFRFKRSPHFFDEFAEFPLCSEPSTRHAELNCIRDVLKNASGVARPVYLYQPNPEQTQGPYVRTDISKHTPRGRGELVPVGKFSGTPAFRAPLQIQHHGFTLSMRWLLPEFPAVPREGARREGIRSCPCLPYYQRI
jgi:hypothetical protein